MNDTPVQIGILLSQEAERYEECEKREQHDATSVTSAAIELLSTSPGLKFRRTWLHHLAGDVEYGEVRFTWPG